MTSQQYNRYSLFPIKYPQLYSFYTTQRDNFWVPAEVDLKVDVKEWRSDLTDADRHFLTHTLAFFAQADGIVLQNIECNFSMDTSIPEANIFYGIQAGIEAIHWEMYGQLIETLIDDPKIKSEAFDAIENYPCIKLKAQWMLQWQSNTRPFLERVIANACAEGIFFSSAFASIYFYKKRGLMPGLTLSNKFIARDEGLHRDFGCTLFKTLRKDNDISNERIYEIVIDAVNVEINFVKESLNVELIGINSNSMIQYVEFVADHLLVELGLSRKYNTQNPFDWMDMISLTGKQNFFEGRVSDYKKVSHDSHLSSQDDFLSDDF
jgi:ribonucleotide reductase beta subunit family protein with ferritin-like domain